MEPSKEVMGFYEWLTLAAIVMGPIIGIFVTRVVDHFRDKNERRLELFKILMRTRGVRLNPEHVGALNLIEIEFYKKRRVIEALEKYLQHLNTRIDDRNPIQVDAWLKNADHQLTKLLYQMAKIVGYEIEQLQILTGSYNPRGWEETEERQAQIQKGLLAIMRGEKAFPVFQIGGPLTAPPTNNNLPSGFPPPPA